MKKSLFDKVQAALRSQIADASGSVNSDIAQDRSDLFDAYMGEPYGDEVSGRSSVVMSDVADTVEWIKPELLEIFTAGDKIAEFKPVGPEDLADAIRETAGVNHVFFKMNNGFLLLYQWFTDALLQKNGYVRADWDERETTQIDEYTDISADELAELQAYAEADGGQFDILEQDSETVMAETELGPVEVEVFRSIKTRTRTKSKDYTIENIAPEDMEVSPRWRKVGLDDAPYCAHRAERPVSYLVEMGFDRKQAEAIQDANDDDNEEEISRFNVRGSTEISETDDADKSTREIVVREAYMRFDIDGDGKSELLKVWAGGQTGEILRWANGEPAIEEVDGNPFFSITPIIVSHRHVGRAIAELCDDLQKIRTVLARQMLDNIYLSNNATKIVYEDAETEHTISDLLNPRPGNIVRAGGAPGGIQYEVPPSLVGPSLQAMEFIDGVRENRTGVTRYNQGLDADSLNKTASGITKILSASQKKILLIARVFAETGVKDLFMRIHRDLRRGPAKELLVELTGNYVPVDPHEWRERDDLTLSVGLGTGDKDALLQRLMMIRQAQAEDAAFGLVGLEERARLNEKISEVMGFKGAGFWKAADQVQQAPPQPDPTQQMLQAQLQVEKAKHQLEVAKMQMDHQHALMEDDRKRDETNIKALTDIEKARASGDTAVDVAFVQSMNQPPQ